MWDIFEPRQFEFNRGELKWSCRCPKCSKKFTQRCKLMHHITTKHNSIRLPNGKLFQCEYCQVKFLHKQSLRKHIETHHVTVNGCPSNCTSFLFMCRECTEKFDCDYSLWCHMMLHALSRPADPETVKQYQCSKCTLKFFHKKDLKKHRDNFHVHQPPPLPLTVTVPESFDCDLCEGKYTNRRDLKRHRVSEHRNERVLSVSDSLERSKKPYKCKVCKSRFAQKTYLKWHMNLHPKRSTTFSLSRLLERLQFGGTNFDLLAHQRWHLHSEKEKILRSQSERFTRDLSIVDNFTCRFKTVMGDIGSTLAKLMPKVGQERKVSHGVDKLYRNTMPNWYA